MESELNIMQAVIEFCNDFLHNSKVEIFYQVLTVKHGFKY